MYKYATLWYNAENNTASSVCFQGSEHVMIRWASGNKKRKWVRRENCPLHIIRSGLCTGPALDLVYTKPMPRLTPVRGAYNVPDRSGSVPVLGGAAPGGNGLSEPDPIRSLSTPPSLVGDKPVGTGTLDSSSLPRPSSAHAGLSNCASSASVAGDVMAGANPVPVPVNAVTVDVGVTVVVVCISGGEDVWKAGVNGFRNRLMVLFPAPVCAVVGKL